MMLVVRRTGGDGGLAHWGFLDRPYLVNKPNDGGLDAGYHFLLFQVVSKGVRQSIGRIWCDLLIKLSLDRATHASLTCLHRNRYNIP